MELEENYMKRQLRIRESRQKTKELGGTSREITKLLRKIGKSEVLHIKKENDKNRNGN